MEVERIGGSMFYRQKAQKLRKRKNVKVKESLEILKVSVYPIFDDKQRSKNRKSKKRQSRIEQKNLNEKNAKEYFYRKAQCNFDTSDYVWHVTFDNEHRPRTEEESDKIFKNLIIAVNRYRKKVGLERARYMAVIEHGEEGKIHWHILIDGEVHRDILETFWKKGMSNIDRLQQNEEGIRNLCKYMIKDPKGKKRYKCSRGNLEEPPTPTINDNKYTRRQMIKMATNEPTKEEIESWYPGYILTKFNIKTDEVYGGVYMNIEMRRYVKNKNIEDVNKKSYICKSNRHRVNKSD